MSLATARQKTALLLSLCDRGFSSDDVKKLVHQLTGKDLFNNLTRAEASQLIDRFKKTTVDELIAILEGDQ